MFDLNAPFSGEIADMSPPGTSSSLAAAAIGRTPLQKPIGDNSRHPLETIVPSVSGGDANLSVYEPSATNRDVDRLGLEN